MNKTKIKSHAALKGYSLLDDETSDVVSFKKKETIIKVDAEKNIITTTLSGKKGYNFVSAGTIFSVAKSLLK